MPPGAPVPNGWGRADRPPCSRRRGAPAWDGQGADHSGGDRRDSSPNLKVTAVALGQNQQKMEWRVENEFHICLVPPRWDPRRHRDARAWSPGGPSRPLRAAVPQGSSPVPLPLPPPPQARPAAVTGPGPDGSSLTTVGRRRAEDAEPPRNHHGRCRPFPARRL